jgi:hypothetical protein
MSTIKSYGPASRKSTPRHKAIDQLTHKAVATSLARCIANANVGHWDAANDALFIMLRMLKAHGIEPKKMSVGP